MRRNIDVLMDLVPADAEEAARVRDRRHRAAVELRRLRMRQAAGRYFAALGLPLTRRRLKEEVDRLEEAAPGFWDDQAPAAAEISAQTCPSPAPVSKASAS